MNSRGMTLLEIAVVLVLLAIALPFLFLPFMQSAKGVAVTTAPGRLAATARRCMETEIITVLPTANSWPKMATGDYQTTCADPGNPAFATTVTGHFYDAALAGRIDGSSDNIPPGTGQLLYLVITVTTTDPATGESVTLQTLKTRTT